MCRLASILIAPLAMLLAGCSTVHHVFPGRQAEQVWTALVAVAETPDYGDPDPLRRWTVRNNDVTTMPDDGRIEIYRRLARDIHRPGRQPQREERTWRIRITLEPEDPPRARFVARGLAVPAHVWDEADRFFNDVNQLLQAPSPTPTLINSETGEILESLGLQVPGRVDPTPATQPDTGLPAAPDAPPAATPETQPDAAPEPPPPAPPEPVVPDTPDMPETVDIDDIDDDDEPDLIDIDDIDPGSRLRDRND